MKHQVTNTGENPVRVYFVASTSSMLLPKGANVVGEIHKVISDEDGPPQRISYRVDPVE